MLEYQVVKKACSIHSLHKSVIKTSTLKIDHYGSLQAFMLTKQQLAQKTTEKSLIDLFVIAKKVKSI